MAPINPKSSRSSTSKPITRKVCIPAFSAPISLTQSQRQPARREQSVDESSEDDLFNPLATTNGISVVSLGDLQDIAERVGKEVDVFAETLDQFKDQLQAPSTQREGALQLCTRYRDHAVDQVKRLKKQHQVQRMKEMRDEFARRAERSLVSRRGSVTSTIPPTEAGLKSLKQWQAEADTWDLFRAVLQARYPSEEAYAARQEKLDRLGEPHRFSSHDDVWQNFVLTSSVARERHLILKWLEQAADQDPDAVTTMAEELEKKAGRTGTWTNGWMETRERIKGAKRMRIGNDSPLDVRRSDSTDLLVSSLDPDAPSRETRTLEKGDALSERSMWITCFEMLRRGKPWAEVCEWCLERNQGWKALSMGVASNQPLAVASSGPASGALWRKMCLVAASSISADEYEAAVYGLLGGDLQTVKKVCRTWNDHIFAHFNSLLMAQFDRYVLQLSPVQLPLDFVRKHGLSEETSQGNGVSDRSKDLIQSLMKLPKTSKEASSALKLVQGSLIGNTFKDLCEQVGTAIADEAWSEEPSVVIRQITKSSHTSPALPGETFGDDPDALRIITHILATLRAIDPDQFANADTDVLDNITAGYVQLIRSTRKRDVTPLYASLMAPERCVASLAQVIADDEDPKDSMDFIKLMQVYGIDAIAVIKGQYIYQLDKALAQRAMTKKPLDLLEKTQEELYPGMRIRLEGLNTEITPDEEALVRGLSIFYLVEGHWSTTFEALASACGQLLGKSIRETNVARTNITRRWTFHRCPSTGRAPTL